MTTRSAGLITSSLMMLITTAFGQQAPLPAAQDLVNQSLTAYRALTTYQETVSSEWKLDMTDEDGEPNNHSQSNTSTMYFVAPNQIRDVQDDLSVFYNGRTLWFHQPKTKSYSESTVEGELDLGREFGDHGLHGQTAGLTERALLQRSLPAAELYPFVTSWDTVAEEDRDGTAMYRITGTLSFECMSSDSKISFTAWLGRTDKLLREVRVDATKTYQEIMAQRHESEEEDEEEGVGATETAGTNAGPRVASAIWTIRYIDVRANEPVDTNLFTFTAGGSDKKVESFARRGSGNTEQLQLVGKPAPEFSGQGLDGQPLSLSSLRGRVVLVDFWATWCGPCVNAIPHVQKLSETYADKPVTVIGINRDGEGSEAKVRRFLEKKKITFRQFMDPEGSVAESYKVGGIPCSVLIDSNGVIQDIKVGFSTGADEEIADNLNKVLAGQPVYSAEELAERMREQEDEETSEDVDDTGTSTNVVLQEVAGERITADRVQKLTFYSQQLQDIDMDGDGAKEIVFADWNGGLTILSEDGSDVSRKRFKGIANRFSIRTMAPVTTTGGVYWALGLVKNGFDGRSGKARVAYYNPAGEEVWHYDPEMPPGYSADMKVASEDLNEDGIREILVGVNTYRQKKTGNRTYRWIDQRGHLVVLDAAGNILVLKRVGKQIDFLRVVQDRKDNTKIILCGGDGKLHRCRFTTAVVPLSDPPSQSP